MGNMTFGLNIIYNFDSSDILLINRGEQKINFQL